MTHEFAERLEALHRIAVAEAKQELEKRGFVAVDGERWQGALDGDEQGPLQVSVRLPLTFPDTLPEVYLEASSLPWQIPNIETGGKLCLASTTGLLIDASRPSTIVAETLVRAQKLLTNGLSGANNAHFKDEFLAYWITGATHGVWSICQQTGPARPVRQIHLVHKGPSGATKILVAEDVDTAKTWASRAGWVISQTERAFFIPLSPDFNPCDLNGSLSNGQIVNVLRMAVMPEVDQALSQWLKKVRLPVTLILSLPLEPQQGYALIAIRLEVATGETKRQALRGFRRDQLPAVRELRFGSDRPVTKLHVERLDADYLLTRGGAASALYTRTVVVVGCGSIGSHVIEHLASLGVGHLRLIDPEILRAENVHRHVLGVDYIGYNKALGMKLSLGLRFPHLDIQYRAEPIEATLRTAPEFITSSDLVLIAIGDETLELRLNDLLRGRMPRLHVWLEPLSIGGHVLATGVAAGSGCFRCLFDVDPLYGLFNRAAFAGPGQTFQQSFAGCAGTFTPFAGVDANRAAIEATALASRVLNGEEIENVLISWRGETAAFRQAGFRLSERGRMFKTNEWRRETGHARRDCPVCGAMSP
jgi:molybdopterin/thiamine biosynthesis adenylyltransferase